MQVELDLNMVVAMELDNILDQLLLFQAVDFQQAHLVL